MGWSRDLRSGLFTFGLSLLVIGDSIRVGIGTVRVPDSGFISFGVGLVMCGLSIALICRGWKVRETMKPHAPRAILALASLFVYSFVLNVLGFIVATFSLVAVLFHLGRPRRWWLLIAMSALVTILAYVVFGVLLGVYFQRGILGI